MNEIKKCIDWVESIHSTKNLLKQTHHIHRTGSWDWDWGEGRRGVVEFLKPVESGRSAGGEYNSDWNTIAGLGFYICHRNDWDWGLSRIQCGHFPLYSYSYFVIQLQGFFVIDFNTFRISSSDLSKKWKTSLMFNLRSKQMMLVVKLLGLMHFLQHQGWISFLKWLFHLLRMWKFSL